MDKKIRVGIIGIGRIGSGKHIPELLKVKECEITALCDVDTEKLNSKADELGIDEKHRFTDYREMIACEDVDAVEVCTPNYLHVPMSVEAVRAGKPFNSEKPLAVDLKQALELTDALKEHPVKNMMCFSYRFMPAVRFAKMILEKKMIGKVVSINAEYLQSGVFAEGRRLEWRFQKDKAGSGTLADLGVHIIDMTRFLLGDFRSVSGSCTTVVNRRQKENSEEWGDVTVDDVCSFLAVLGEGTMGSFTVTKCAIGHGNTIRYDIFGTEGVISFDLNHPEVLDICIGEIDKKAGGLHRVNVPAEYFVGQEQTFIDCVNGKECQYLPTAEDGIACQKILDAVLQSIDERHWIDIE